MALAQTATDTTNSPLWTPSSRVVREAVAFEDLAGRLDGKNVAVGLSDGKILYGVVASVSADAVHFRKGNRALSGGGTELPKENIRVIQYDVHRGKSRKWWSIWLGLAGAGAAMVAVASERVCGEGGECFYPLLIGMGAGGATGGCFIGRERDRTTFVLTLR